MIGGGVVVTKRKTAKYWPCRFATAWVDRLDELRCGPECYVFPPFNVLIGGFRFDRHLTVQRYDQILQRLDPTLTSHHFRYGAAEKLLRLGYTPHDLKELGDWSSTLMPDVYAKRSGYTPSQTRFAMDIRTTGGEAATREDRD
jgi:hypothetical protein